jgi:hydroxymethylpyrimidine/phosphomethylpyrimidine kinase
MKNDVPVALTIAGSDSSGGAGIQIDLKTFAALGVYGTSAITSITAQNTQSIAAIEDLTQNIIREQIRAIVQGVNVDAAKTGMLRTKEIIKTVATEFSSGDFPLIVDPIMVATSGSQLLEHTAVDTLKNSLLPYTTVITPNRLEAEKISNTKIRNLEDAKEAAKIISEMGPKAVVIKGGHFEGKDAVDLLYYEGKFQTFTAQRLDVKSTHGTGFSFSAAITAGLAKGLELPKSVETAKELVTLGIQFGLNFGKGYGPVNPLAKLYRESARFDVLMDVEKAKVVIERSPEILALVPEVGLNIAMALPYSQSSLDVASIDGRFTKTSDGAKAVGISKYGCSSHLTRYILEITKHNEKLVSAVNLKFSEDILNALQQRNLTISFYDRTEEPENISYVEGMTIPWGVKEAVKRAGKAPDVIYHRGGIGKEPMIVIFGVSASDLAKLVVQLAVDVNRR